MIVNSGVDKFKGKVVKLANDIDLAGGADWVPIGARITERGMDVDGNETTYDFPNQFNAFEGTFDGQNHSVTNYTDTNAVYNGNLDAYSALFGAVSGSIIKNLTIDNFNLTGNRELEGVASHVYGAASFSGITVKNSTFTNNSQQFGMGAIFARAHNYSNYSANEPDAIISITDCHVVDVTFDCGGVFTSADNLDDGYQIGEYKGANVGSLWGSITLAKDGDSGGVGQNTHIVVSGCSSNAIIKNCETNNGTMGGYGNCRSITYDNWTFTGALYGYNKADGSPGDPIAQNIVGYSGEAQLFVGDADAFAKAIASPKVSRIYLAKDLGVDTFTVNRNLLLELNGHVLTVGFSSEKNPSAITVAGDAVNNKINTLTVKNGTIAGAERMTAQQGTTRTVSVMTKGKLVGDGAIVKSVDATAGSTTIRLFGGSADLLAGGKIVGDYAVGIFNQNSNATFNMKGGEILADSFGIIANGQKQYEGYKINITGGRIISGNTVMYLPSAGTTSIKGSAANPVYLESTLVYDGTNDTVKAGYEPAGIVIRAGTLNINGYVTLKVNAAVNPNATFVNGGSDSYTGAIVIGRPESASATGYAGNIVVNIIGTNIDISNADAGGDVIKKFIRPLRSTITKP